MCSKRRAIFDAAQVNAAEEMDDQRYFELAAFLAERLQVDVAIGDFSYEGVDSEGQYIVLSPLRLFRQGVECVDDRGHFSIHMQTDSKPIQEFRDSASIQTG